MPRDVPLDGCRHEGPLAHGRGKGGEDLHQPVTPDSVLLRPSLDDKRDTRTTHGRVSTTTRSHVFVAKTKGHRPSRWVPRECLSGFGQSGFGPVPGQLW